MARVAFLVAIIASWFPLQSSTAPTDFSGSWTLRHVDADPRSAFPNSGTYLLGSELTIAQDGATLVVTQSRPRAVRLVFKLDGSGSQNTLPNPNGPEPWHFVSHATWQRGTLVIDTTGSWDQKMRWSLTPAGDLSVQEWAPNIELVTAVSHTLYSKR